MTSRKRTVLNRSENNKERGSRDFSRKSEDVGGDGVGAPGGVAAVPQRESENPEPKRSRKRRTHPDLAIVRGSSAGFAGGFTLLEGVLAMAFIAIAIIPLLGSVSGSLVASQESQQELIALHLATAAIESSLLQSFDTVAAAAKTPVAAMPVFSREVTVTTLNATLKQVDVDVFWKGGGAETSVRLSTLRTN